MKKIVSLILAAAILFAFTACGSTNEAETTAPQTDDNSQTDDNGPSSTETKPDTEKTETNGKILVVYFSWSGNLDKMAHWVADETGGDLVRVTAKEAYPDNYNDTANRAKKEQDDGVRPAINVDLTVERFAEYDTVFFGFPVWWYDLPMPMWTLLESFDFSGKTVIPFFSHEGCSNGANALPRLEELAKGAAVKSEAALSIRGGEVAGSEKAVKNWVNELGYSK